MGGSGGGERGELSTRMEDEQLITLAASFCLYHFEGVGEGVKTGKVVRWEGEGLGGEEARQLHGG